MPTNQNTAILVFTRTAVEEGLRKRYTRNADVSTNRQIAHSFILKTLNEAYDSGFPVFTISSDQQKGASFGERFTNAIADIFDKGYAKVITIGTDTPDLKTAHLQEVAQLLETHDYVAGPSVDGGVYVLGISKKVFDKQLLKNIPWQTATVHHSLNRYIQRNGYSAAEIELLTDIDDNSSFNSWLAVDRSSLLSFQIKQLLLKEARHTAVYHTGFINQRYHNTSSYRGPPATHN